MAFRNEYAPMDSYPQRGQHYQLYVAGTDLRVTKHLLVQTAKINYLSLGHFCKIHKALHEGVTVGVVCDQTNNIQSCLILQLHYVQCVSTVSRHNFMFVFKSII